MGTAANGDAAANGDTAGDVHERAREGLEHLQAAARELIAAARAALDVAEDVVNDPDSLAAVAGMIGTVGDLARRMSGGDRAAPSRPDGDAALGPRVEHIPVV
jgi:hypothetical protein